MITQYFGKCDASPTLGDNINFLQKRRSVSTAQELLEQDVMKVKKSHSISWENIEQSIPSSWMKHLASEVSKPYFYTLKKKLISETQTIFPEQSCVFRALELTAFESVKVVILGQDPYHNVGQAHGLAFSVPRGIPKPSSLQNIFKEIKNDLGEATEEIPSHGCLDHWAEQGVLLLNTGLTVRAHQANSHKDLGWKLFTDCIIKKLNEERDGIVFLLWGKHAQEKAKVISTQKHHVLCAAHPSGLSAHRGFFGCKHFSKTNEILRALNRSPIKWI
jgi:uracil-DNA glycosylase